MNKDIKHSAVMVFIVVMLVILAVVMTLLTVFIVLYIDEKSEKEVFVTQTTAVTETIAPTQKPTEPETQEPTKKAKKKTSSKTESKTVNNSYTITVYGITGIYSGPGYDYSCVDEITQDGVYTIVEEHIDPRNETWGKLKSGVGWINIRDATTDYSNYYYPQYTYNDVPYTVKVYPVTMIYSSPSYYSDTTGSIDEEGVFTIVEESYDEYMNKWGKLKSGAGWIPL